MLTPEQIAHVRRRVSDAPFPDEVYEYATEIVDAYARVAGLLELAERAEMEPEYGPPWVTLDEVRRALTGG